MKNSLVLLFVVLLILFLVDLYAFRGVKALAMHVGLNWLRKLILVSFWLLTIVFASGIIIGFFNMEMIRTTKSAPYFQIFFGAFILFLVPKLIFCIFLLLEDIVFAVEYLGKRLTSGPENIHNNPVTRREFLTWAGMFLGAVPFASILYGITLGKFNFRVVKETGRFSNLPTAFDGLRIAVISDLHLGSFHNNYKDVIKGFNKVNELKPDIIFFTGDLVNNYAEETVGWEDILSSLKAPLGKYSILGNHDYGDYSSWETLEDKANNLRDVQNFHKQTGFRLLLNESVILEKEGESISLIGVENWGAGGFAKYGDLKKSLAHVKSSSFKILLSHDPSHWDAQVLEKTNVDLTFSGHTHGFQFGVEKAGIKWSPVQYRYPRWAGLYEEGKQKLYVNRGFGYIGFPGRVGIPPEITLFELKNA